MDQIQPVSSLQVTFWFHFHFKAGVWDSKYPWPSETRAVCSHLPCPRLWEPGCPSSESPGSGVVAGGSQGTRERGLFGERSEEKQQENTSRKSSSGVEGKVTGEETSSPPFPRLYLDISGSCPHLLLLPRTPASLSHCRPEASAQAFSCPALPISSMVYKDTCACTHTHRVTPTLRHRTSFTKRYKDAAQFVLLAPHSREDSSA